MTDKDVNLTKKICRIIGKVAKCTSCEKYNNSMCRKSEGICNYLPRLDHRHIIDDIINAVKKGE